MVHGRGCSNMTRIFSNEVTIIVNSVNTSLLLSYEYLTNKMNSHLFYLWCIVVWESFIFSTCIMADHGLTNWGRGTKIFFFFKSQLLIYSTASCNTSFPPPPKKKKKKNHLYHDHLPLRHYTKCLHNTFFF